MSNRLRGWLATAASRPVVRRALLTALVVGTLLTLINHADYFITLRPESHLIVPVLLTYLVPYVFSTVSSVAAHRWAEGRSDPEHLVQERATQLLSQVPGRNPNPVMRMTLDGQLAYANEASAPVRETLGIEVGDRVPEPHRSTILAAAQAGKREAFEITAGLRTYSLLAVAVPDSGLVDVYGSDITGQKVLQRFPDRNPNPVMRMSPDGRLVYANDASGAVIRGLGLAIGDPLPPQLRDACMRSLRGEDAPLIEVSGEGRTFAFKPVHIPEFEFVNLYGTDITALKALDKFPDRNPNPVMRVSRDGLLTYANPASEPIRRALHAEVGKPLPEDFVARMLAGIGTEESDVLEVAIDGRIFELLVVSLYEFDSINLYGTEVTAARAVADANRENERLLLNILPSSIAERLRHGELVIADRFDEMTVMFADCVKFTELSSQLNPTELVKLLNEVFSVFDRLADRYGLEKIKTIGDAYMVVGGLTADGDGRSHVARVADMALDIQAELAAFRTPSGEPIKVRIGIHAGPTVAGVIGLKKFIYDVWGDAVNMASRMESQGIPGKIQVSAPTYERLVREFTFEPRGKMEIKGKGTQETFFLTGRRRPAEAPPSAAERSTVAAPD